MEAATRETRYAEAIVMARWPLGTSPSSKAAQIAARAVMAVADEEQAADRAEMQATIDRLGERVAYYRDSEVPALRSNADGWAARAEAAEAEIERLRGEVAEAKAARDRWRNEVDYAAAGERLQARRDTWADIAATLNDRAVMWEQEGRRTLAQECKGMANACRTYAEGVGVPSVDSLRQKRREAQARLDALVADLRGLADEWGSWGTGVVAAASAAKTIRAVLDKHADARRG
jgi:uncharacterized protein YhaN